VYQFGTVEHWSNLRTTIQFQLTTGCKRLVIIALQIINKKIFDVGV